MYINKDLEIICMTDVGLKRSQNEDFIDADSEMGLAVLADGMGGYQAGEVASELTVTTIIELIRNKIKDYSDNYNIESIDVRYIFELMSDAAELANNRVFEMATTRTECMGMGTTLVLAMFFNDRLVVGHAGDSRMYRYRYGSLVPLTLDHSILQAQIAAGLITPEQAKDVGYKNLVTRAIGVERELELEMQDYDLLEDDLYLMCSDGLTDLVDNIEIEEIVKIHHSEGFENMAKKLIEAANNAGGKDNISVILVGIK